MVIMAIFLPFIFYPIILCLKAKLEHFVTTHYLEFYIQQTTFVKNKVFKNNTVAKRTRGFCFHICCMKSCKTKRKYTDEEITTLRFKS